MILKKFAVSLLNKTKQYLNENPSIHKSLTIFGALILATKFLSLSGGLYRGILRPMKDLKKRYGDDSWAVITGGTHGIGRAFAQELGKLGFNICLISRHLTTLVQTQTFLQELYPNIKIKLICHDFSEGYVRENYEELQQELSQLDVSILVNNVGVVESMFYHETEETKIYNMIYTNCYSQAIMTRILIKQLIKRKETKNLKSAIINVSAAEGVYPMPFFSLYSATKAFNDFFSRSLSDEYNKFVDIISLRPYAVSSSERGLQYITPKQCARACLRNLGYVDNTFGDWRHDIQNWVYSWIPRSWLQFERAREGETKAEQNKIFDKRFKNRRNFLENA